MATDDLSARPPLPGIVETDTESSALPLLDTAVLLDDDEADDGGTTLHGHDGDNTWRGHHGGTQEPVSRLSVPPGFESLHPATRVSQPGQTPGTSTQPTNIDNGVNRHRLGYSMGRDGALNLDRIEASCQDMSHWSKMDRSGGGMTVHLSRAQFEILKIQQHKILKDIPNISQTEYTDQQNAQIYFMLQFLYPVSYTHLTLPTKRIV